MLCQSYNHLVSLCNIEVLKTGKGLLYLICYLVHTVVIVRLMLVSTQTTEEDIAHLAKELYTLLLVSLTYTGLLGSETKALIELGVVQLWLDILYLEGLKIL